MLFLFAEKDTTATEPFQVQAYIELYKNLSQELDNSKQKLATTEQHIATMEILTKEASQTEDYRCV